MYGGTVTIRFDYQEHCYYRVDGNVLVPIDGVTSICRIIDKSGPLVGWAAKKVAERILEEIPAFQPETGELGNQWFTQSLPLEDFTRICMDAKLAPREHLEEAGDIGHQAHKLIEEYIKWRLGRSNEPDPRSQVVSEKVKSCFDAALDWETKHNVRWIATESVVYSKSFQYAGTLDGLALVDSCGDNLCCPNSFVDHLSLVDWKSSNYLYPEYLLQTAAYQYANEEEFGKKIDDRWIIRLGKEDGRFEAWHVEQEAFTIDFQAFISALNLSRCFNAIVDRVGAKKDYIKHEIKRKKQEQKAEEKAAKEAAKAAIKAEKAVKKVKKPKKEAECHQQSPE